MRRDTRLSLTFHASRTTTVVLSAYCNEGSRAVTYSASRYKHPQANEITWHGSEIPKLTINRRCLRQASAPGWPRS
jgi:hypothetical protein